MYCVHLCALFLYSFSRWTSSQVIVPADDGGGNDTVVLPGSIAMDGEIVTASLRAVHALSGILDHAADNESEMLVSGPHPM